ncbi:thioredoxin TrxC [Azotobacter chroococcum subsp. isscasi]|uniref:thioredoxin TrxC n=1 Tax=Azotobacter chroococcum TaxID=353 RepID=UPI001038CE3C|nr:thioredoxin TrxC [Azotobacter chroococcum]TBW06868.1 thioredoxin TrxC [Azotobacter chroococcum subsp. isscasi]
MTDALLIPCPHCHSLNRIPAARLGEAPRCGRCKSPVLPGSPFAVDAAGFAAQLRGGLPLLLDVWADWCGPCKAFAPVFEQAARELSGRVRLAKLDSEAEPQLAGQLGIRSIPSLILFRDGREVARQSGALPLPQLLAWLRQQGI